MIGHLLLSAVYADGDHGCLDVTPLDDHLDVVDQLLVIDERCPVHLVTFCILKSIMNYKSILKAPLQISFEVLLKVPLQAPFEVLLEVLLEVLIEVLI